MTASQEFQLRDSCSNKKSSPNEPANVQVKSPPCPYAYAVAHIRKTLSSHFRGQDISSEILDLMRILLPENTFRNDFWKWLLVRRLPSRIQPLLIYNLPNYTGDQLSHMADIVYEKIYGCPNYCLYITDQVLGTNFLIDTGCSRSAIPLKLYERITIGPLKLMKIPQGQGITAYGIKEMIVKLDHGRFLRWNFIVADVPIPVIGADFLAYYDLLLDLKGRKLIDNQFKPTLYDAVYENSIMCCKLPVDETGYRILQGYEKPSEIIRLMQSFMTWKAIQDDFWKRFFLSTLPQSFQSILDSKISSCTINELAFQADSIYEQCHLKMNHCLSITDRISGLTFLVDSGSHLSQIPCVTNELSTPIPFCRCLAPNGSDLIEYGQKNITLDLNLDERFTWNFVITNVGIPIIGADFITYYDLCIDLRRRKLIRNCPSSLVEPHLNQFPISYL